MRYKVFKNLPSEICGMQHVKFFKSGLPQILLSPFLNAWLQMQDSWMLYMYQFY